MSDLGLFETIMVTTVVVFGVLVLFGISVGPSLLLQKQIMDSGAQERRIDLPDDFCADMHVLVHRLAMRGKPSGARGAAWPECRCFSRSVRRLVHAALLSGMGECHHPGYLRGTVSGHARTPRDDRQSPARSRPQPRSGG